MKLLNLPTRVCWFDSRRTPPWPSSARSKARIGFRFRHVRSSLHHSSPCAAPRVVQSGSKCSPGHWLQPMCRWWTCDPSFVPKKIPAAGVPKPGENIKNMVHIGFKLAPPRSEVLETCSRCLLVGEGWPRADASPLSSESNSL